MNQLNDTSGGERRSSQHPSNERRTVIDRRILIIVGVAVLLLAGIWIWKSIQVSNVRRKAETDQRTLREEARIHIRQTHEAHLKLLAKPLLWAIRSEMMQGNLSQVNLYANDMVKEKNIQRIVIANAEGIIVSSTNKKDEGKQFSTVGKQSYLLADSTVVETNDSIMVMSSPIMGFNNRLGTFMLTYKAKYPR